MWWFPTWLTRPCLALPAWFWTIQPAGFTRFPGSRHGPKSYLVKRGSFRSVLLQRQVWGWGAAEMTQCKSLYCTCKRSQFGSQRSVGHLNFRKAKLQGIQGLSCLGHLHPNVHTPPHKHRIKNKSYFLKGKFGIYSPATPAEVPLLFVFCIQGSLEQN